MPHKLILQQAVSDTAMDIQEAENGTETSKLQFLAGVYILPFISILVFIKTAIFSRFYKKNWVHFIKNSDFLLKNDQIWPEIAISDHKKLNASK